MTIIALLVTVAIATCDLADDNDEMFFHDFLESSYISIFDVAVSL